MTWNELLNQAIDYFNTHEREFTWSIEELDSWSGFLEEDRIPEMYEIDDYFENDTVKELMKRALDGHDCDGGEFNLDREYWYREYWTGNLVSTDTKDYSSYLDDPFIECLYEEYADTRSRDGYLEEYMFPEPITAIFEEYYQEHGKVIGLG